MFKWKDEYSVNINEIDKQHKKLFEIGSRVYDIASIDDEFDHYDEIMDILGELRDYTIYHFDYEEKLLEKYNFEQAESHKFEHIFFVKKIERIERKDIDGEQNEAILDIIKFVADWIASHILKADMEYKELLNGKGVY